MFMRMAQANFVPLKAGEMTVGDHLRPLGVQSVLIGKTHMRADAAGMVRLGTIRQAGSGRGSRNAGSMPSNGMTASTHGPGMTRPAIMRERDHGFSGDNPWGNGPTWPRTRPAIFCRDGS